MILIVAVVLKERFFFMWRMGKNLGFVCVLVAENCLVMIFSRKEVVPWFVEMISLTHWLEENMFSEGFQTHLGRIIASVGGHYTPWWMPSKPIGSWWQPTGCWHPIYLTSCVCVFFVLEFPAQIGDLSPNAFSDGLKRDMHPSMAQHKYLWLPTFHPSWWLGAGNASDVAQWEPCKITTNWWNFPSRGFRKILLLPAFEV